jgi:O-antigen/teichoic acid export membrane protein
MSRYEILVKRFGLVAFANLFLNISGIILLPILTKNLSVSEYGIWIQILVTIGLIPAIVLIGLPYSMVRFLASIKDKREIRDILGSISLIIILAGLAASALIFVLSEPLALAIFNGDTLAVKILSFIVFIECLNNITINYFRALQQIKRYVVFTSLRVILNIILVAYFVIAGYGIHGALFGLFITVAVVFISSAVAIIFDVGLAIPKIKNIRDYLFFGIPTVPGNLSSWAVSSIDRYIIGFALGTAAVGFYSPGYTLGSMIGIFMNPISFLLPAVLSKFYDEDDLTEVRKLMNYSMRYFLGVAIPSVFGLSLLSLPILTVLSTPEIASQGYLITPFISLSALLLGVYATTSQVILLEKKTKIIGTVWIIAAILSISLNLILVPHMGIIGAAITSLLTFALTCAVAMHYANKYLRFNFDPVFVIKSILASLVMSTFLVWFHPERTSEILICIAIGALIYFVAMILLRGLSKNEARFLRELLGV